MDRPPAPGPTQWTQEQIAALWSAHRGWVAALLYAHLPRPGSAGSGAGVGVEVNDLLQEVAVSLVANIHTLDSPERIGPWLRTVALNVARDAGRRQHVRRNTHCAGDALDALPAKCAREAARENSRDRGRRALQIIHALPPRYREPLLLNLRGLSQKQVADVMDLPLSTVETRLFRARAMVRQEMEAAETDRQSEAGRPEVSRPVGQ